MHSISGIISYLSNQQSSLLGSPATHFMVDCLIDSLSKEHLPHPSDPGFWRDYLFHDGIAFNGGCLFSVSENNCVTYGYTIPHLFDENVKFHQKYRTRRNYSGSLFLIGRNDDCMTLYNDESFTYSIAAREDLFVYSQSPIKELIVAETLYINYRSLEQLSS